MQKQSQPMVELLTNQGCRIGEGPLWHPEEKRLYWTDIPAARLYRCRDDGSEVEQFPTGGQVGGFTLQEDGSLLLFMEKGAIKLWRNGKFTGVVVEQLPSERDSRFNDVIADPEGRVYCGTMSSPHHQGRFYRLDTDGSLTLLRDDMLTPNGMGFSPDLRYLYQNDSRAAVLYRFRYHRASGELSGREVIFQAAPGYPGGRPDGMTVDADGFIWTARWDGGRIVRHAPDGTPREEILFPVAKVTSLAIAGENSLTAFCTTAGGTGEPSGEGKMDGAIFRCRPLPAAGIGEFRSRVKTPV